MDVFTDIRGTEFTFGVYKGIIGPPLRMLHDLL